jgi:large subunit ribosomal protein L3
MKFILAEKQNMTQIFDASGKVYGVTILNAPEGKVVQVKTKSTDGYSAVQVGFGTKKAKRISKPVLGHMKDLGTFKVLREFRLENEDNLPQVGDVVNSDVFAEGDMINVSSLTKGKGFQGVVKRHGFAGGPRTHGQRHSEREPGSIGGGGRDGGRVAKGMRMAGRMGGTRVTVKGLKIIKIDKESNQIYVFGAVPGRKGTLIEVVG